MYTHGSKKMLVFAVLLDRSGLTVDNEMMTVVHKKDHQLPLATITFDKSPKACAARRVTAARVTTRVTAVTVARAGAGAKAGACRRAAVPQPHVAFKGRGRKLGYGGEMDTLARIDQSLSRGEVEERLAMQRAIVATTPA